MFSTRLLFFSRYGVVGEYSEARGLSSRFLERNLQSLGTPPGRREIWPSDYIEDMVREVMKRRFTKENDILHACSGMLKSFGDHRYGIPLEGFENCLLWSRRKPKEGEVSVSRRRSSTTRDIFPSWSFSIHGQVDYGWSEIISVSTWGFTNDFQGISPSFTHPTPFDFDYADEDEFLMLASAIAWQRGCLEEEVPTILAPSREPQPVNEFVREFEWEWETYNTFWEDSHGIEHESHPRNFAERFSEKQIRQATKPGRLLVYTQTAFLTLVDMPRSAWGWGCFGINNGDDGLGHVVMDTPEGTKTSSTTLEFLALSISRVDEYTPLPYPERRYWGRDLSQSEEGYSFEGCGYTYRIFPGMRVLAVETKDGISRRLGLGTVLLDKWLGLERNFKSLVLE